MYDLPYTPSETERENASNAYLLTLMTVMVGLPFPVINLFACIGFYFLQKNKAPFVKFHTLQAITSQVPIILMNSGGIFWTIHILFYNYAFTNNYIAYVITIVTFNIIDIVYNIIGAIKARKGLLYSYSLFGPISWSLIKIKTNPYV